MAIETRYAQNHLAGTFATPENATGNTPSTWAGVLNQNSNYASRWSINDPVNPLTAGATHTVRVMTKKGGNSGHPTISIDLYDNGVLVSQILAATSVTSTTGEVLTATFTTAQVSNAANVEIHIDQISAGGSPSVRNSAQVAYIQVDFDTTVATTDRKARVSFAEAETPNAPRRARIAWSELEAPEVAVPRVIVEAVSSNTQITADGTYNIPLPAGTVSGDILVVQVVGLNHSVTAFPSGHTVVGTAGLDTAATGVTVFYFEYAGGTPQVTIDIPATPNGNMQTARLTPGATLDQSSQSVDAAATQTHTSGSITPTQNNALILGFHAGNADTLVTAWSAPLTEQWDAEYWGLNTAGSHEQTTAASISFTATTSGGGFGDYIGINTITAWVLGGTDRRARVSFAEAETPSAPRRARVAFTETEVPNAARRARVAFTEAETPDAARRVRVSWSEAEAPNAPRRARVSFAEAEAPTAPRRVRTSFTELEIGTAPRRVRVAWTEAEAPNAARRARVAFAEAEAPNAPRRGRVAFTELEVGAQSSAARIAFTEFEIATAPRRVRLSWAEAEAPTAPRRARVSFTEVEFATSPRRARVSFAETELTDAPRRSRVSFTELEVGTAPRKARLAFTELETDTFTRKVLVSFAHYEIPNQPGASGGRGRRIMLLHIGTLRG